MKVAFFGSYLFLVPIILERFSFVDVYIENKLFNDTSINKYCNDVLMPTGMVQIHWLKPDTTIASTIPDYDIGFSASFGRIFKNDDLNKFKFLFNLHPGPFSHARGRHPLPIAVKYNHPYIGVTLHQITDLSIDSGPILLEWKIAKPKLSYDKLDLLIQSMSKSAFKIAFKLICDTYPEIQLSINDSSSESYYSPLNSQELSEIINS